MILDGHTHTVVNTTAATATYSGAALTGMIWGLHIGDVAIIISTLAAVCGALIQVLSYLDRRAQNRRGGSLHNEDETL